jgi:hypothetical protein
LNGSTHYSADEYAPKTSTISPPQKAHDFEAPEPEKVHRSHDAARATPASPIEGLAEIGRQQRELLDKLKETLDRVMSRVDAPAAAIGSPYPANNGIQAAVDREIEHRRMTKTVLQDGAIAYGLPLDNALDFARGIVSDRQAYIDRGSHLEVTSTDPRSIEAAVRHASSKWEGSQIRIHDGDAKDVAKIVRYAVQYGVEVENRQPEIVAMVAAERERQRNPLVRDRSDDARERPLIERVQTGRER